MALANWTDLCCPIRSILGIMVDVNCEERNAPSLRFAVYGPNFPSRDCSFNFWGLPPREKAGEHVHRETKGASKPKAQG